MTRRTCETHVCVQCSNTYAIHKATREGIYIVGGIQWDISLLYGLMEAHICYGTGMLH